MLGEDPQRFMFKFPGLLRNTPVLEKAAGGRGLLTINPERDGIVRRVPMIMQAQGTTMPSLSFEMLRVATGTDTIFIKSDQGRHQERRASRVSRSRPTATASSGFISPITIRRSMFRRSTCSKAACAPEKIARKLVLIGTSAVGLNDIKTTPVSPAMPGVEIHAQVLESGADQDAAGAAALRHRCSNSAPRCCSDCW